MNMHAFIIYQCKQSTDYLENNKAIVKVNVLLVSKYSPCLHPVNESIIVQWVSASVNFRTYLRRSTLLVMRRAAGTCARLSPWQLAVNCPEIPIRDWPSSNSMAPSDVQDQLTVKLLPWSLLKPLSSSTGSIVAEKFLLPRCRVLSPQ